MMKKNEHDKYMKLAIKVASSGVKKGQTPFGACVVKNGKVIVSAHNTVFKDTNITSHAEINAIKKACKITKKIDLSGAVIYSTCEPCPMCFSACHWARISTIVYGASIKDADAAGFNELHISNAALKRLGKTKVKIIKGVLREENIALFEMWKKRINKKAY